MVNELKYNTSPLSKIVSFKFFNLKLLYLNKNYIFYKKMKNFVQNIV